jgi:hypothetical protein
MTQSAPTTTRTARDTASTSSRAAPRAGNAGSRRRLGAALAIFLRAALPLLLTGCMGMADNPECRSVLAWADCDRRLSYVKSHAYLDRNILSAVLNGQVVVGMPADAVIAAWERPHHRNISSGGEEWVYGYMDKNRFHRTRLVIFHGDRVTSWHVFGV